MVEEGGFSETLTIQLIRGGTGIPLTYVKKHGMTLIKEDWDDINRRRARRGEPPLN